MKGVLLLCLMGVHVDKKNIQVFVHIVLDIYEKMFAHGA
jgi:hypothetical protein